MKSKTLGTVLVLNADFSAIAICSVKKAVILTFGEKADLVSESQHKKLHSASGNQYPHPTVIRLKQYVKLPFKKVPLTRTNVFKRDNNTCLYCGQKGGLLTVDHIIPKSRGGSDNWENLATACHKCNNIKGDQTPNEAGMKLLVNPTKPNHITFLRQLMGKKHKDWEPYLFVDK